MVYVSDAGHIAKYYLSPLFRTTAICDYACFKDDRTSIDSTLEKASPGSVNGAQPASHLERFRSQRQHCFSMSIRLDRDSPGRAGCETAARAGALSKNTATSRTTHTRASQAQRVRRQGANSKDPHHSRSGHLRIFGIHRSWLFARPAASSSQFATPQAGKRMADILKLTWSRPLFFFVAALVIYAASTNRIGVLGHIPQSPRVHYLYLADSFLKGHLDLAVTEAEVRQLSELVPYQAKYYVVYPPVPAVLLMPFVSIFGKSFKTGILSILLAASAVALTYVMLRRYRIPEQVSVWVTILFGFGTGFWFHSINGSSWYLAQITAVFFLLLALVEAYGKRRPVLIGAALGAAMLSRLPVLLATPFFLYLYARDGRAKVSKASAMLVTVGCF